MVSKTISASEATDKDKIVNPKQVHVLGITPTLIAYQPQNPQARCHVSRCHVTQSCLSEMSEFCKSFDLKCTVIKYIK